MTQSGAHRTADAPDAVSQEDYWQGWFDGTACPNPGKIGVGAIVLSPQGNRIEKFDPVAFSGCNNEAELRALTAALILAHDAGARHLVLRGDSDMAIRHVLGTDSTRIARFAPLIAEARAWLRCFEDVQLQWIPCHRNQEADRCSRDALGLPERSPKSAIRSRKARR